MGGTGDWDIDSYRSFYESDEHWALKKEFMETHYHAMPEERLVCMAQVYANIELLGCRYPQKVMEEVSDLAKGIGKQYKESKKNKLQRTFVKASDAAGAKVRANQGQKRKNNNESSAHEPMSKKMLPFVRAGGASQQQGPSMMSFVKAGSTSSQEQSPEMNFVEGDGKGKNKQSPKMMNFVKSGNAMDDQAHAPKMMNFMKGSNMADQLQQAPKIMNFVKGGNTADEQQAPNDTNFVGSDSAGKAAPNQIMSFIKAVRDDNPKEDREVEEPESEKSPSVSADKCMSFIKSMRGSDDNSGNSGSYPEAKGDKYRKAIHQNAKTRITFPDPSESSNTLGRGIGRGDFRSERGRGTSGGGGAQAKDKSRSYAKHLNALMRSKDPLCDFILVQRTYTSNDNPTSILDQSAMFSQIPIDYEYEQNGLICHVSINGVHVASAESYTKKGAKDAAAVDALELLLSRCFTIRILTVNSSAEEIGLSEVSNPNKSSKFTSRHGSSVDTPIEDSSVGSKLLKMMGWSGGGLGKDGGGIAEPIKPSHVFGRTGLGHEGEQGVTHLFKNRIRAMLKDYQRGSDLEDLAFSPMFSKEQRAEIHKMSRTMNLKSHSHGKGENRFLVISRKFSPRQLLYRLLQEGPTDKYELIPPGETV